MARPFLTPTARLTLCHMSRAGGLSVAGKVGLSTAYMGEAAAFCLEGRGRVESARCRLAFCGLRAALLRACEPEASPHAPMCTRMIAQPAAPSRVVLGRTIATCRTFQTLVMPVCARICRI